MWGIYSALLLLLYMGDLRVIRAFKASSSSFLTWCRLRFNSARFDLSHRTARVLPGVREHIQEEQRRNNQRYQQTWSHQRRCRCESRWLFLQLLQLMFKTTPQREHRSDHSFVLISVAAPTSSVLLHLTHSLNALYHRVDCSSILRKLNSFCYTILHKIDVTR